MKHILIDFENVQPEPMQLNGLDDENCHIWLFLGKLQQKALSVELCEALCRFGKNVHFVRVAKTGKNALDFYLAYYLGKITEQDKNALVCILSRDGGFDVLVEHLKTGYLCRGIVRLGSLEEALRPEEMLLASPFLQNDGVTSCAIAAEILPHQDIKFIGECQKKVAQALMKKDVFRPHSRGNLISAIHKFILCEELGSLDSKEKHKIAEEIVAKLEAKGFIKPESNGLLSYHFVNHEELLEILTQQVKASKAKTVTALQNVIRAKAAGYYYDLADNDIDTLIAYLKKKQILKQAGDKIEYAPFTFPAGKPAQPIIVNNQEDVKIIQAANQFFTKCAKNKPTSKKALVNSFKATLKLQDQQIETLIQVLTAQKKFTIGETGKITYQ
ncbi:PIN domain-containing protein [Neisseria dentiae]|uniref:PIN domain-containing protein n=1 Tax=Neisseria dentiae TaxID=194197 RepID=UPI00359F2BA4